MNSHGKWLFIPLLIAMIIGGVEAGVVKSKLKPTEEMYRADIYLWKPDKVDVRGVLLYCPGHNGNGKKFAERLDWQKFAQQQGLAICAISFASHYDRYTAQWKGYSHAERGSGDLIFDFIEKSFPKQSLPVFVYGYSAGARLTASIVAWKPDRVAGFCASGVGRWPQLPTAELKVPSGMIACGEYDAACYWSSLNYFQRGRKQGRKWTWISLKNLGHGSSKMLDLCFQAWIQHCYLKPLESKRPIFYDLDTKLPLDSKQVEQSPEFAVYLPLGTNFQNLWLKHHHP